VVPMFPQYDEAQRKYVVSVGPPLEDFPSGDSLRDLERINALLESQVRQAPEQYWWIHRRFKTRPAGEAPFYD
jgi:KDO2-lipid IV(A) lauroyltransferase